MRQKCVCCVVRSVPPSQFVVSVKSIIVLNVLHPHLWDQCCLLSTIQMTFGVVEFTAIACFVGKVCSTTWSTWGASSWLKPG